MASSPDVTPATALMLFKFYAFVANNLEVDAVLIYPGYERNLDLPFNQEIRMMKPLGTILHIISQFFFWPSTSTRKDIEVTPAVFFDVD
jgi:hypothetical protein